MPRQSDNQAGAGERVFIRDGLRSYRRTYRVGEVYWGAGVGALLLGIVGWVLWKGQHPDPSLFDMSAALGGSPPPEGAAVGDTEVERRAPDGRGALHDKGGASSAAPAERGPLPSALAAAGFHEGKIGRYSSENLYVKINGRAGFFQSFGVRSLHTVTLEGPASEASPRSVDIELYDLGESRNAIGAYNGERPPGVESLASDGSTYHFDRNAAFLARGPYYIRFIGSDESPAVVAEVRRLLELFQRELQGEALPWGFALFVDQLKLSPSAVTYIKSNAFSFGFARDVFKASLSPADSRDDMEAFVVATDGAAAAQALAAAYAEGFGSLGAPAGKTPGGTPLFKDEFLASFSGAAVAERWVVGVRGAPSPERAREMLDRLQAGIAALPEEVRARAVPSADAPEEPSGEHGAGAPAPSAGEPGPSAESSDGPGQAPSAGEAAGKPAEESDHEY